MESHPDFHPGTELGIFVVNYAGGKSTTIVTAIEGPEPDEMTLECSDLSMGEPSGFTFSVRSAIQVEMTRDYFDSVERRPVLDSLSWFGGEFSLTVGDHRARVLVYPDRYSSRTGFFDLRDESSGDELATIAAIQGDQGCIFIAGGIVVTSVIYIITRHRENMRAIELCVPLSNPLKVKVSTPAGSGSWEAETAIHKTHLR